jgi:hypothetical protein
LDARRRWPSPRRAPGPPIFTERAPFIKRLIAKIVGFDGAYHRFTGKVTIEKFEKDARVEIFHDHAIWELMYLGKARSPTL